MLTFFLPLLLFRVILLTSSLFFDNLSPRLIGIVEPGAAVLVQELDLAPILRLACTVQVTEVSFLRASLLSS